MKDIFQEFKNERIRRGDLICGDKLLEFYRNQLYDLQKGQIPSIVIDVKTKEVLKVLYKPDIQLRVDELNKLIEDRVSYLAKKMLTAYQ